MRFLAENILCWVAPFVAGVIAFFCLLMVFTRLAGEIEVTKGKKNPVLVRFAGAILFALLIWAYFAVVSYYGKDPRYSGNVGVGVVIWTPPAGFLIPSLLYIIALVAARFSVGRKQSFGCDVSWRHVAWEEESLRQFLRHLPLDSMFYLQVLVKAGGTMRHKALMNSTRFEGCYLWHEFQNSINARCKRYGKAPILTVGTGNGDDLLHRINSALGDLRQVVNEEALAFRFPPEFLAYVCKERCAVQSCSARPSANLTTAESKARGNVMRRPASWLLAAGAALALGATSCGTKDRTQPATEVMKGLVSEETQRADPQKEDAENQLLRVRAAEYSSQIGAAQGDILKGDCAGAEDVLTRCAWDFRDWEHHFLWTSIHRKKIVCIGHTSGASSVAISPDGKRVASGGRDNMVRVWDTATGQATLVLKGHSGWVGDVAFSPDGQQIASTSRDGTLKLWDATTGDEILTIKGHRRQVSGVAFSPDGKLIATGGGENTVNLWDALTGNEILTLKGHKALVSSVAFSGDGHWIVSGGRDNTVKVWDLATEQATVTIKLEGVTNWVGGLAFSPDGQRIAAALPRARDARVWDASTGQEVMRLKGHNSNCVAFSPDGKSILSGGQDNVVRIWDAAKGQEILSLKGHTGPVSSVKFSPDGKRILSGSDDETVTIWDVSTDQETRMFKGHKESVRGVAFSPDGKQLVSGGSDGMVKTWDVDSGQETLSIKGHAAGVASVVFSADQQRIVSCGQDSIPKVWNAATGQEILALKGHAAHVNCVAFSPDGRQIVSGSDDKTAKVWDAFTGLETLTFKGHADRVYSVVFSPDGKRIASGSQDNTLRVWDATTGQETLVRPAHSRAVRAVAFSADGTRIVSGSEDGTAKLWDVSTGREIATLIGHTDGIRSVAFGADGRRIVSSAADRTVRVWDTDTGQQTIALNVNDSGIWCVAFSPDGKRIVGSGNGTLHIWEATMREEPFTLQGHGSTVCSVAVFPHAQRLASGGMDGIVKIWDLVTGKSILTLNGNLGKISSVAISPDEKQVVVGGKADVLKVWDLGTAKEAVVLTGHSGWVSSVAFSPDGKRIVSGGADKTLKVWDAATGRETLTLKGHSGWVSSVAISPDGTRIASGSEDQTVRVWDAITGKEVATLKGHTGRFQGVSFTPDGTMQGPNWVSSVAFSPDGKRIASGGDDTVKVWEVATGEEVLTLEGHTAWVTSVAFSKDGRQIAAGSGEQVPVQGGGLRSDQTVRVWDAVTGEEILTLKGHKKEVRSVAFSPDGKRVVSGSGDGTVKVWDVAADVHRTRKSDPFGHPVVQSYSQDTKQALGKARSLISEKGGLASRAEFERQLRSVAAALPLVSVATEKGKTTWQKVTLNRYGNSLDAIRFVSPLEGSADMRWVFVAPADALESWYITPRQGTMQGFRNFNRAPDYSPAFPRIPKSNNLAIFQALDGGEIQPKQEYLLWFTFPHQRPVTIYLAICLIPHESAKDVHSAADIASDLGLEPPGRRN